MTAYNPSKSGRENITLLFQERRFEEVLTLLSTIEQRRALSPAELVTRGQAIQLCPEDSEYPLEDARKAFEGALASDPEFVPATLEIAWYFYAVMDDSERAKPLFEKAVELSRSQFTEAARGYSKCLAEIESPAVAASTLRNLHHSALLLDLLLEEEQDWLEDRDLLEEE